MSVLPVPAIASANTRLFLGTAVSPSVFSGYIGRLGNIQFGGVSVDVVDVSNQESVAHRMLGTLLKVGDMTATLFWEPSEADDQELFGLVISTPPPLRSWKLEWPDGSSWLYNAYVTQFAPKADIGKELNTAFKLTVDDGIVAVY